MKRAAPETVPVAAARRLLLAGAGLAGPPRKATRATTLATVRGLGFVQVDSINAVERAHHLILHARLDGYRPEFLSHHLESSRELFEHWTHDASVIRRDWLAWWTHRFERDRVRLARHAWMRERLGTGWKRTLDEVRTAIAGRGPLSTRDFPTRPGRKAEGWWDWSPHKAALELLWRSGEIAVHSRRGFEKVYDLAERVHGKPEAMPERGKLVDFACGEALARLGTATPRELSQFLNLVTLAEARAWSAKAAREARAVPVLLERNGRKPSPGVARIDWRKTAVEPDPTPRALAPFDPLIRDRIRLAGLFGFAYRFEAFVPAAKRMHGYYTLPVLVGDSLVARVDASSDREAKKLRIARAWLEPGPAARHRRATIAACERLAEGLGLSLAVADGAFRPASRETS